MEILLMVLMLIVAVFLILLVLVQRGRGGGLAGALGGMGGQSAFGTKAGDLFTRITIGVATVWIVLCMISVKMMSASNNPLADLPDKAPPPAQQGNNLPGPAQGTQGADKGSEPAPTGDTTPATATPPTPPAENKPQE